MSHLKVTKTLYVDALPIAEQIEAQYGLYLLPPEEGYYLPTSLQPVLRPHRHYYQKLRARGKPVQVATVVDVASLAASDIFDDDAQMVVSQEMIRHLALQPQLPVRGLALVSAAVDCMLQRCIAWKKVSKAPLWSFLAEHFQEEFRELLPEAEEYETLLRQRGVSLAARERNSQLADSLTELLAETMDSVRQFVGEDKWVMHFHHTRGLDVIVEKTVDFRIFDWERRMASGEWK